MAFPPLGIAPKLHEAVNADLLSWPGNSVFVFEIMAVVVFNVDCGEKALCFLPCFSSLYGVSPLPPLIHLRVLPLPSFAFPAILTDFWEDAEDATEISESDL